MNSTNEQTPQVPSRERRRTRQRMPFGDEDLHVVFAGLGLNSIFQHRIGQNKGTAIFFHEDMLKHAHQLHETYPECPNRLSSVYEFCQQQGLLNRCLTMQPDLVTDEILRYAHSQEYIDIVSATSTMKSEEIEAHIRKFDSAVFNKDTNIAARLAVGSLTSAVTVISRDDVRNAICLTRPPGHHAMVDEPCGFCVFNNVEIAAKFALTQEGIHRVLIVDWDVHHGQATQYAFYNDPKVLYFSIHRYDNGEFWPNLRESDYDFAGEGRGFGYNINVPLNGKSYTDSDYLAIFNCLLMPISYEFDPDLIIVSAGFDCALGCPLGGFSLTPSVFAHMTHRLMALAEGKLIIALEGGYNLESLSDSVATTISTLLGDPLPSLEPLLPILPGTALTIRNCVSILRTRWKSLSVFPIQTALPLKDTTGLSINSWRTVMKPQSDAGESVLTDEEVLIATEKLAHMRKLHKINNMQDKKRVCLVYDSRMENHKCEEDQFQPECPMRLRRAYELLEEYGLTRRCKRTEARTATREELLRVHSPEYIDLIQRSSSMTQPELLELSNSFDSVYFNKHSYDSAILAVGSLLNIVDDVCNGKALHGVAVIRPPGHHAESNNTSGFCIFNNVALAVCHAKVVHNRKRIAIIDWDVHHGNGIQYAFENDPDVLYISLHRYDEGRYFPGSIDAASTFCGQGSALGTTINLPWSGRPVRDGDYICAFNNLVLPILYNFRPELIFVAAGFDAARGDHLGGFSVSPECFGHLTHLLTSVATLNPGTESNETPFGGVILALEGGYNLAMTSESLSQCVASLLGGSCLRLGNAMAPTEKSAKAIRRAIDAQINYWNCLFDYSPVTCYCDPDLLARCQAAVAANTATTPLTDNSLVTVTVDAACNIQSADFIPLSNSDFQSIQSTSESTLTASSSWQARELISYGITEVTENSLAALITPRNGASLLNDSNPIAIESTAHEVNDTNSLVVSTTVSSVVNAATLRQVDLPSPNQDGHVATTSTFGNQSDPHSFQNLVEFSNAGIDDIPSFFGLSANDPIPDRVFAVEPILWCDHLESVASATNWTVDLNSSCSLCPNRVENWVCLTCYQVYCGRYSQGHMLEHYSATHHPIVLSYADLSAWCYACNNYVHNEILSQAKQAAHFAKFGERMAC